MVRPGDAVDQPELRARRRARAAGRRRRRRLLPSAEQRQRWGRDGLHNLDREGRQRRLEHEHELRRAGLGDELERREERLRGDVERDKREGRREKKVAAATRRCRT